jgi:hypothetical protein
MAPNRFLFALFLSLVIFSCEDDDPEPFHYPATYTRLVVEAVGAIRVFDKTGELTSPTVIQHYTEGDTSFFNAGLRYYTQYTGLIDTVKFADATHGTLMQGYSKHECTIQSDGGLLILSDNVITNNCCTGGEVYSRTLNYNLGQVKDDVYSESIRSSTGGNYLFDYSVRRKFVLRKQNGKLIAPVIVYRLHAYGNDYAGSGNLNNVLEPDFYKVLRDGDVLTMIESQIVFNEYQK